MADRLVSMNKLEGFQLEGTPERRQEAKTESRGAGRPRFKWINREQNELRVFVLDQLIEEQHAARAIWEFLGELDLTGFEAEIKAVEGRAGQATFEPRLLAALWLYAYSEGIGSAREVARCCEHEPGFRWLCGEEGVNYHTLADFRVQHEAALHALFVDALGVLSYHKLVTLKRVAHDGTRIRAWASGDSFHRETKLEQHLSAAEAQVSALESEAAESGSVRQKAARRRAAEQRWERLRQARQQLEQIQEQRKGAQEKAEARVSESEPEARIMKMPEGRFAPAYNAQVTTDSQAGIIVNAEVTQLGSDFPQLTPALEQVKENFGKLPDQVLADGGFLNRENIVALEGRTDLIGPYDEEQRYSEAQRKRLGIHEEFATKFFIYDPVSNQFQCPAGKALRSSQSKVFEHKVEHYYRAVESDCQACPHKTRCCPQTRQRSILRIEEVPAVQRFRQKMQAEDAKTIYKQRARLAEFPFCWIKEKFRFRRFHVRGLAKAQAEILWAALAYNIRQWMRLCWNKPYLPSLP
jgi:transposase